MNSNFANDTRSGSNKDQQHNLSTMQLLAVAVLSVGQDMGKTSKVWGEAAINQHNSQTDRRTDRKFCMRQTRGAGGGRGGVVGWWGGGGPKNL